MEDTVTLSLQTYNDLLNSIRNQEEKINDLENMVDTYYKVCEGVYKTHNLSIIVMRELGGYSYKIDDLNVIENK